MINMENSANGKNREDSGNLPAIRNDKDGLVIDMKLKGRSNKEIAEAAGMNLKTVQNVVSKGGRLYSLIEALRGQKTAMLREDNQKSLENLLEAKNPAIQELVRLALESDNDIVRLRGIHMILEMTGIWSEDKPPLLDPSDMNGSVERILKWLNGKLITVYRDMAPVISLRGAGGEPIFTPNPEDLDRLEKLILRMEALNNQKHIISGHIQYGEPLISDNTATPEND